MIGAIVLTLRQRDGVRRQSIDRADARAGGDEIRVRDQEGADAAAGYH